MPCAHPRPPLQDWLEQKTGLYGSLSSPKLQEWQFARLANLLVYVKERSRFYRRALRHIDPSKIRTPEDLQALPLTSAQDIERESSAFVCLPQSQVARIITLSTSGTTGPPKRLFFSTRDQELCVDFFAHGMRTMLEPGETAWIYLGRLTPGNTVDLLCRGLERSGIRSVVCDTTADAAGKLPEEEKISGGCLVGMASRLYQIAKSNPNLRPRSVLLCADYVPAAVIAAIRSLWNCKIFTHYGSTESGLGGAVSCGCDGTLHPMAADLLFEIIDPATGLPMPDGEYGEVVFTTLSREAMPLVRYRTGDISRMLRSPCACGSQLPRLDAVRGRYENLLSLPSGGTLSIHRLDEILFSQGEVLDYTASLESSATLCLTVRVARQLPDLLPRIASALEPGLRINLKTTDGPVGAGYGKRRIERHSLPHLPAGHLRCRP